MHAFAASLVLAGCLVTFEDYPLEDSGARTGGRSSGGNSSTGGDDDPPGSGGEGGEPAQQGGRGGTNSGQGGSVGKGGTTSEDTGGKTGTTGGSAPEGGMQGVGGSQGTGGTGETTGGVVGTCDCQPGSTSDPLLIQNFEDGSAVVLPHEARAGHFFTFVSQSSTVTPLPDTDMTPECSGGGGDCYQLCAEGVVSGSDYAVAALAVNLADDLPYNVNSYLGVTFSIAAEIGVNCRLDFHAATTSTLENTFGGACVPTAGYDCNDHFSETMATSSLTGSYAVYFSLLRQGGWGVPASWIGTDVIELHWQVTSETDLAISEPFRICLDDVKFFQ